MGVANYQALQRRIGHEFLDRDLLLRALTHRSVGSANYERLEFLGDALLGFVVARMLFERFPHASESDLTLLRVDLVRRETLAAIGRTMRLGDQLILGTGERKSGGSDRESILADTIEAIFGAVLCDAGFDRAAAVVERLYEDRLDGLDSGPRKDPKTQLQEALQARKLALPAYAVVASRGADHDREYEIECRIEALELTSMGWGSTRREAEKDAAEAMLRALEQ